MTDSNNTNTNALSSAEILRYSRHSMLPEFGFEGQQKLHASHVLVVGLGGLGSAASLYLASAGVGTLTLADSDHVEVHNLQRQVIHSEATVGELKVESAKQRLEALNSHVKIQLLPTQLQGKALLEAVGNADLVVDATDNFATRFAINEACVAEQKPLVSAAAIRGEGQLSVFDSRQAGSPCYRCLYPDASAGQETCAANGVLAPLVGTLGSLQALEAIKVLSNAGEAAIGRLLLVDAWRLEWRQIKLTADPNCPVCGTRTNDY